METVDCNKIDAKYFYVKKEGQKINQSIIEQIFIVRPTTMIDCTFKRH